MKLRTALKPIAFALLIVFLSTVAVAQNPATTPKPPSKTKLKWIALGSVIGGASLALVGAMSGKDTATAASAYSPTPASSSCTGIQTVTSTATACVALIPTGVTIGAPLPSLLPLPPGVPLSSPTPVTVVSATFGVPTSIVSLSTSQSRGPNWKMIVPAIGAASVGAFVLYRDHARTKRAELSVRPDGTAQLAFKW